MPLKSPLCRSGRRPTSFCCDPNAARVRKIRGLYSKVTSPKVSRRHSPSDRERPRPSRHICTSGTAEPSKSALRPQQSCGVLRHLHDAVRVSWPNNTGDVYRNERNTGCASEASTILAGCRTARGICSGVVDLHQLVHFGLARLVDARLEPHRHWHQQIRRRPALGFCFRKRVAVMSAFDLAVYICKGRACRERG